MKIKIEGNLYMQPNEFAPANPRIVFFAGKTSDFWLTQGYILMVPYTIEVDAPEIDIVGGQVKCLIAKRDKLTKEFEEATGKIDDALAQLKCLTFDASGVAA